MIIYGIVDTRKYFLIHSISHELSTSLCDQNSPLILLALIGIFSFNIHAKTIHLVLKIPIKDMQSLHG
jgi:hypothetical protein